MSRYSSKLPSQCFLRYSLRLSSWRIELRMAFPADIVYPSIRRRPGQAARQSSLEPRPDGAGRERKLGADPGAEGPREHDRGRRVRGVETWMGCEVMEFVRKKTTARQPRRHVGRVPRPGPFPPAEPSLHSIPDEAISSNGGRYATWA